MDKTDIKNKLIRLYDQKSTYESQRSYRNLNPQKPDVITKARLREVEIEIAVQEALLNYIN